MAVCTLRQPADLAKMCGPALSDMTIDCLEAPRDPEIEKQGCRCLLQDRDRLPPKKLDTARPTSFDSGPGQARNRLESGASFPSPEYVIISFITQDVRHSQRRACCWRMPQPRFSAVLTAVPLGTTLKSAAAMHT